MYALRSTGKSVLRAEVRKYAKPPGGAIAKVIMLPRKPAKLNIKGTRTANGHT